MRTYVCAGDMRRANGLVARYRLMLHEDSQSVLLYNLLMKVIIIIIFIPDPHSYLGFL